MHLCYIDEAGNGETLVINKPNVSPVFVMVGLIIDQAQLHDLTMRFIGLKRVFFPRLMSQHGVLRSVLEEIKSQEIRRAVRNGGRNERRAYLGFVDKTLDLVEGLGGRICGRVCVKAIGAPIDETAMYTHAVQDVCTHFNHYLEQHDDHGLVIADSRTSVQNIPVAHAVFTQSFKMTGDAYPRLYELPTFAHSNNHVGLQVVDLIAGVFFATASRAYCSVSLPASVHTHKNYDQLRKRYSPRLKDLQHRYQDSAGKWRGGIVVDDKSTMRSGGVLFSQP